MAAFPSDEDPLIPRGPRDPAKVAAGMSADAPAASLQEGAATFPKLPEISEPVSRPKPENYDAMQASAARDAATAKADADRAAESAARTQRTVETKRLREQGVQMTVDDQNQAVPQTRPDGSMVFEPGWTGSPRFDAGKKSWVRDRRDETGKVEPIDLWDNGDMPRDTREDSEHFGELYITLPGGVRQYVAKDEAFLRKVAIGKEIDTVTRQQEEKELALDRRQQEIKLLEDEHKAKKKAFEETATRLRNMQSIGIKNPAYLKANDANLRAAQESFETAKREFLPLREKFEAIEEEKKRVESEKISALERKLSLAVERDTLDAARRRPEFAAPAAASAEESPEAAADRGMNGIGGDAYRIPDGNVEEAAFRSRMNRLDTEAEQLAPGGLELGPNPARDAKLAEINQRRRDEWKAFAGRKAAIDKFTDEDKALQLEAAASEGRSQGKSIRFRKNIARLDDELSKGLITPKAYGTALAAMEKEIETEGAIREGITAKRAANRKATFEALRTPEEFPATLITKVDGGADLDPRAVNLRAAGRAAAFGTRQVDELYEVLDEIQQGGKVQMVGGRPIKELIREIGAQKGLKLEDLLTTEETDALRRGLRGGLIQFQGPLLHNRYGQEIDLKSTEDGVFAVPGNLRAAKQSRDAASPALDGEVTLSKPVSDEKAAADFWRDRFAQSQLAIDAPAGAASQPEFVRELQAERDAIRNRQPTPPENWATMTASQKREFLSQFEAQKAKDLEAFTARQVAMGGDRADWVNQFQGEKPMEGGAAFLDELGGRLRAAVWSPTAGIWDVGAGLIDTLSHLEAIGRGVAPEETGLYQFAQAARQGTQDLMGERSDTLLAQVGRGVGSSLAFAPLAMTGGLPAVAAMGASSAFGSGYFEALDKAAAKGKQISQADAYLRGAVAAGLGALEGIPIANALNRLDKFTGGSVKRVLNALKESGEEFAQEFVQSAVQGAYDAWKGLSDDDWKKILGDSFSAGTTAGLSGLLMGISMNAVGERSQATQTRRVEAAFGTLDRKYSELSAAIRSPEALAQFNVTLQARNPDGPALTMEKATDLLKQTETARNTAAVQVLMRDEKLVTAAVRAADPTADVDKISQTMAARPTILPQVVALGKDMGSLVVPESSRAAWNSLPQNLLKNAVAGHIIVSKMQEVLRGGRIEAPLGAALERQGFLIQKPTEAGGTRWVFTAPALELMDGDVRRAVARDPSKYAVDLTADTERPGKLAEEFQRTGDAVISSAIGESTAPASPAPASTAGNLTPAAVELLSSIDRGGSAPAFISKQLEKIAGENGVVITGSMTPDQVIAALRERGASKPAAASSGGSYSVILQSVPDAKGFTTRRTISVRADSPEAAGPIAEAQARSNKWKGEWTAVEIKPDSAAGGSYPAGDATGTPAASPGTSDPVREGTGTGSAVRPVEDGASTSGEAGGRKGDPAPGVEPNREPADVRPAESTDQPAPAEQTGRVTPRSVAERWANIGYDFSLLKKSLPKLGVSVTQRKSEPTSAVPARNGDISVNFRPEDIASGAIEAHATISEELWHAAGLIAKRKEWEAAGKPGNDFTAWVHQDARIAFEELIDRLNSLEGAERREVENAMVGSFNLYFSAFVEGGRQAVTTADITRIIESGGNTPVNFPATYFGFIHEFARQMAQLRQADSVTEATFTEFIEGIIQWLQKALSSLKAISVGLDAAGGVLDGTMVKELVVEMEREMRTIDSLMDAAGRAEMAQDVSRDAMSPVMNWIEEQGGVIGKGKATNPGGEYDDAIPVTVLGGHARKVYGTALTPDEAAQGLFEAGLIPDASATAMWMAIESEARTLRGLRARLNSDIRPEAGSRLAVKPRTPQERASWIMDLANAEEVSSSLVGDPRNPNFLKVLERIYLNHDPVRNEWDGKQIQFPVSAWKKMTHHLTDKLLQAIIPSLPKLVRKAMPAFTESDTEAKPIGWYSYGIPVRINGVESLVKLVGFEELPGRIQLQLFHDATVTDYSATKKELEADTELPRSVALPTGQPAGNKVRPIDKDKLLRWLVQVNRELQTGGSKNSTQINIPPALARQFLEYGQTIRAADLYTEPGYGLETNPHVTVLYGLEGTPAEVEAAVADLGPIELIFGKTSLFENEDRPFDVLKVDVTGPDIRKLNAALQRRFQVQSDFPVYRPHLTIAYLKKGTGRRYANDPRFKGKTLSVDGFVFSDKEEKQTPVRLGAKPRTIETTGEGNLFAESEMPFNLQGEVDTTAVQQAQIDDRRASEEAEQQAADAQGTLFVRPRRTPQQWMDFGPDGTQLEKYQLPLTLGEVLQDAPAEAKALFNRNLGLAHKIANDYRNLGDWEDVRQEALIAMSRAAERFDPSKGAFSSWAGRIIRNHLNDLYGKMTRRIWTDSLDAELGESGQTLEDVTGSDEESPAVSAERAEALGALQKAIDALPEELREVVTRRLAGETQEAIGQRSGVTKQQISNMEKVAMGMIRGSLRRMGIESIPLRAKPRAVPGQETFTGRLDSDIFPPMVDRDMSRPPDRKTTPAEADAVAENLMRDAKDIADVIENRPEEEGFDSAKRSTVREHYNRHLRGRFDKMNYFAPGAGDVVLDANRSAAYFAAAMRQFQDSLEEKVRSAFGYPSWWRNSDNARRMKRFRAEILPYAAALNPVSRDAAGDFVFEDFWQRAGELSGAQIERMNRKPGEEWVGVDGERWRVGGFVVPDPKKPAEGFYQYERFIPAAVQEKVHAQFHDVYPEAAFLLDDFIEPGMDRERIVSPQGIEVPSFNRHSLYGFYGDTPAGLVEKLPGYTPDVTRTKSIAGIAAKVLKLNWQSPGRDYKSGQARVSGQVRDLFEGFNIRAAQAHMETSRRDMAEKLLKATIRPVPESGIPPEFKRLDRDTLNPLIRAMRQSAKKGQTEMPEITAASTDRLTQKDLETLRFLFGDPRLFDPNQMIHREVLAELERGFVRLKVDNEFLDGVMSWLRGNVAGVLADFQTISINKLSNYIFHTLRASQRVAYAAVAAAAGDREDAKFALREAGFLMRGFFTNFYHPAVKERMNRMIPPELFEDQNIMRQLLSESADLSVADLLKQANVGGAVLKAVGYGEMDVRAKQKVALASLLARASIAADDLGVAPHNRREWMQKWVEEAPIEARREAEMAAKLYLMDYANVPWWLDQGRKIEVSGHDVTPWVNFIRSMAIPFWKYPYNYLRQMKRLSVDSVGSLTWRRNLAGQQEKREAMANLASLAMLATGYWLLTTPWGDDDEEILGRDVDAAGDDMDPKLRTSSRIRLADSSILGMAVGTAARMFGADAENDDLWVRVRTLPYATQAMALGAALRYLKDPSDGGAKQAISGAWDMLEDFMSVGSGARLGLTVLGYRDDYTRYQDVSFMLGQGAFDMATGRVLPPRALRDLSTLIDPINRRYTPSESLDYFPGFFDGLLSRLPVATKTLPPSGKVQANADPNSSKTQAARAELESLGLADVAYREYLDEETGKLRAAYVRPEFIFAIPGWKAAVRQLGFNVKPVPRDQYQTALAGE